MQHTKKCQASKGGSVSPNTTPVSGNLREYLFKALCTRSVVCGSPEPRASGAHMCMVLWLQGAVSAEEALKGAPNNQAREMGETPAKMWAAGRSSVLCPRKRVFLLRKALGPRVGVRGPIGCAWANEVAPEVLAARLSRSSRCRHHSGDTVTDEWEEAGEIVQHSELGLFLQNLEFCSSLSHPVAHN